MQPGSKAWKELLTASRFAAAAGVHPYTSRNKLWEYSVGLDKVNEQEPAIQWGLAHEAHVIDILEKLLDLEIVRDPPTIVHGAYGATPDGLIGSSMGVEVKCPFSKHELPDAIPLYHQTQIQGNMWLTGRPYWFYTVWIEDQDEEFIKVWRVEQNPLFMVTLKRWTDEYLDWHGDILADVPRFKRGEKQARIKELSNIEIDIEVMDVSTRT